MCDSIVSPPKNFSNRQQQEVWLHTVKQESNKVKTCVQDLVKSKSLCVEECKTGELTEACAQCAVTHGCKNANVVRQCTECIAAHQGENNQCTNCSVTRTGFSRTTKLLIFLTAFVLVVMILKLFT